MKQKPEKLILSQRALSSNTYGYVVERIQNSVEWLLGDELSKRDVQDIIERGIEVTIKPRS